MDNCGTEIWRPLSVATKSMQYEVSNEGRVRSIDAYVLVTASATRGPWMKHHPSRIKKLRCSQSGYAFASIDGKPVKVARLVAAAFLPDPGSLRDQVNHIDGNKRNDRADNLEWCTASENMQHAFRTGLIDTVKCGSAARGKHWKQAPDAIRKRVASFKRRYASDRTFHKLVLDRQAKATRAATRRNTKIPKCDIPKIKAMFASGQTSQKEIAAKYGVSTHRVWTLINDYSAARA